MPPFMTPFIELLYDSTIRNSFEFVSSKPFPLWFFFNGCFKVHSTYQNLLESFQSWDSLQISSTSVETSKFQNLPIARGVMKESFRLRPSPTGVARILQQDLIISGYLVPKGVSAVNFRSSSSSSSIVWRIKESQFINHNFKTMPHSADQSRKRTVHFMKSFIAPRYSCCWAVQDNVVHILRVFLAEGTQCWLHESPPMEVMCRSPMSAPYPVCKRSLSFRCCMEARQRLTWVPKIFPTQRGCLRPLVPPGVLQVKIWARTFIKWVSWT